MNVALPQTGTFSTSVFVGTSSPRADRTETNARGPLIEWIGTADLGGIEISLQPPIPVLVQYDDNDSMYLASNNDFAIRAACATLDETRQGINAAVVAVVEGIVLEVNDRLSVDALNVKRRYLQRIFVLGNESPWGQ